MTGVGDITTALRSAQAGLLANQQVLNVIANNVANVNTPGYSRKNPNLISRVTGGVGSGVIVSGVSRQVNEDLLRTLRIESSTLSSLKIKGEIFDRTQELFGTPGDNTSIAHITGEFVNAIESLAKTPSGTIEHNELVRRAENMTVNLRQMSATIQELRRQVDVDIAQNVDEINKLTNSIKNLNGQIASAGNLTTDDTSLRDARDQDLVRLSELIDVTSFQRSNGEIVVFTTGGRTIVDSIPRIVSHLAAGSLTATTTKAEGDINGIFVGAQVPGNDITSEIRDGEMKGLLELRDNILPDMQSQLDELSAEAKDAFNHIHNRGAPYPGMQSATGTRHFVDSSTQTISFGGTSDTKLIIMDSNGDETASISLRSAIVAQVDTLTIGGSVGANEAGDTYTATINGTAVTYTVTSNEPGTHFGAVPVHHHLADIRNAFLAAINANPVVSAAVTATAGGPDGSIILTSNAAGTPFTSAASFTDVAGGVNDSSATVSTTGGIAGAGPYTIDAVAAAVQTFLQANDGGLGTSTAAVSTSGTFDINLTNTALKFVIRDEGAAALGSTAGDATINFDSGGVVGTDETVNGLSNFFGLNDFFVDGLRDGTHESNVLANSFSATAATLRFNDKNGAIAVGAGTTLTVAVGTSLQGIADLINDSVTGVNGVEAGIVPDGSGFRLRITNNQGINMIVTQDTTVPDTLLTELGMHVSDASSSQFIQVRSDIVRTPGLATTGAAQWDANLGTAGEYFISPSDDTTIQQLAAAFTSTNAFDTAGGVTGTTTTFFDFASSIVVDSTSKANANLIGLEFQESLTDTLQLKSDNIKGVNLDEELSNLILFEQAFNAAARVISVIQNMIKELNDAIR
jgi:flagellar hook-associated protein 1 FlgK